MDFIYITIWGRNDETINQKEEEEEEDRKDQTNKD